MRDRLTFYDDMEGFWRLKYDNDSGQQLSIDRLAAYEDTGMEPEEVQEIAWRAEAVAAMNDHLMSQPNRYEQAEFEGRLIVLPSDPYEMADVAQEILSRACRLQREAEAALGGDGE